MVTIETNAPTYERPRTEASPQARAELQHEVWAHWPVNWSAVWVGALAALATATILGLCGIALGLQTVGNRLVDLKTLSLPTMALSVFGSFLAFVIGGWVAAKIAGILRAEPAMLHGAIVWLVAVPLLAVLATIGAGSYAGGWYSGLAPQPPWALAGLDAPVVETHTFTPVDGQVIPTQAVTPEEMARQRAYEAARAARNSALCAATALLLGLMGSVIGGWMGSDEPMTFGRRDHKYSATFST
jgi:hypothetical protein